LQTLNWVKVKFAEEARKLDPEKPEFRVLVKDTSKPALSQNHNENS
jgi:hypothetical protein